MTNTIPFNQIPWIEKEPGYRTKEFATRDKKLILVEATSHFEEKTWCTKAHLGYVLEGACLIDINGQVNTFKKGDGLVIEGGEKTKHKLSVPAEQYVLILLFE